jgi:hypothetical protein
LTKNDKSSSIDQLIFRLDQEALTQSLAAVKAKQQKGVWKSVFEYSQLLATYGNLLILRQNCSLNILKSGLMLERD